jgi:hypothetical protein
MASIGPALRAIKSELAKYVPDEMILDICRQVGHEWRRRVLDPATTVHLLLLQLLGNVALIRLHHLSQIPVSAVAVCKARLRLPLKVLMELVGRVGGRGDCPRWKDRHRVVIADATTFLTEDTPELARTFAKARNQKATRSGYPVPKLLMLVDWANGLIHRVIVLPHARNEQTVLSRLFAALRPGDLLLGDRGLVSFAHLALMMRAGLHGCLRLPRNLVVRGRGKGQRRRVEKLGKQDLLVSWVRPQQYTLSWLSRRRWEQLPQSLTLRQITFRLKRQGFRTQWAWVITTLTCPHEYAAQEIVELYGRRWQIEVCFRDLKHSLEMRKFSARSLDGVKKQMLAFVLVYNLVRLVMAEAAQRQGVTPDRISFRDALTWLLWSMPEGPPPHLIVNPRRRRPTEPRARKHGGYLFPVLKYSRHILRKPAAEAVI